MDTTWTLRPEDRPTIHAGEYAVAVAFVRDLESDMDVITHAGDPTLTAGDLAIQLATEMQEAYDSWGGIAGSFQVLAVGRPAEDLIRSVTPGQGADASRPRREPAERATLSPPPLKALAWMIRNEVEQSTARLADIDAAEALTELTDVDSVVAWMIGQGAEAAALTECLPNDEEREALKARAEAEKTPRLRAVFYDTNNVKVDSIEGEAAEVAARASQFMILHGTDPDEKGAAASRGYVEFFPA